MRAIVILLLVISSFGCGDANRAPTPDYPLTGFWGGYFPGSSLEDPREGVEIHFERQGRNGFIHRDPGTAHRAPVTLERDGNDVTLTFAGAKGDVSTFQGSFVDADRIRGRFTNPTRGESFPLDLVEAGSVGLIPLRPAEPNPQTPSPPVPGAPLAPHLTLQIAASTESGANYKFLFGLGWYFTPGTWTSSDTIPDSPTPSTGPSAVLQLLFFPSWIVFDMYAYPSQIILSASLEVALADFINVNVGSPQTFTPDETSFVGVWPDDDPATSVTMSFVETDAYYDRVPWPTRTTDPKNMIIYDGQTYLLPSNMADMLIGFVGVS